MVNTTISIIVLKSLSAILGLFVAYYVVEYLRSPLKQFNGPFWAKFTDWWRVVDTSRFKAHETQLRLHKKYGPVVRLGPNCLSISDPKLAKTIYAIRGSYYKTEMYSVNDIVQDGHVIENIFSTRDQDFHAKSMRPIQKMYTMNGILTVEYLADKAIATLCRRLEEECMDGNNADRICDIGAWLLWCAWDCVGEVTFSEPIGFLEEGDDINNMLETAEKALEYFAVVSQMPQLDKLLAKNPYYRIGPPSFEAAGRFCAVRLFGRLQAEKQTESVDFLNRFIDLKDEYPGTVTDNEVIGYMLINILAGADTTAVTLRAIIYYLLKNPHCLALLDNELKAANLPMPIPYRDAVKLPYLNAVVREAMRIHPGVGLLLERFVPAGGLKLPDGRFVPAGTIVGLNPWVVHRDTEVFGADAHVFNPGRWLKGDGEDEDEYNARLKRMKDADLTFGAGSRVCLGKNLALLEVYKLIPTLFMKYDFELADPDAEWKVKNVWFTLQEGINVKIRRR